MLAPHQCWATGMAMNTALVVPATRAATPIRAWRKGGGGGEAESLASGFATIRIGSLTGERPAMTPIGRLVLCLGWIRRLED